jgi:hypothetical protein
MTAPRRRFMCPPWVRAVPCPAFSRMIWPANNGQNKTRSQSVRDALGRRRDDPRLDSIGTARPPEKVAESRPKESAFAAQFLAGTPKSRWTREEPFSHAPATSPWSTAHSSSSSAVAASAPHCEPGGTAVAERAQAPNGHHRSLLSSARRRSAPSRPSVESSARAGSPPGRRLDPRSFAGCVNRRTPAHDSRVRGHGGDAPRGHYFPTCRTYRVPPSSFSVPSA